MIILITCIDDDGNLIASHGYDVDTTMNVVVSQDHPTKLGAVFDRDMGEWVIR
jgi:hypothetical protein